MSTLCLSPSGVNLLSSEYAGKATLFSSSGLIPGEFVRVFHNYPIPNAIAFVLAVSEDGKAGSALTFRFDRGHQSYPQPHLNEDWKAFWLDESGSLEVELIEYSVMHIRPYRGSSSLETARSEFGLLSGSQTSLTELFAARPDLKR